MYCSVILRGAVRQTDKLFTYRVPDDLSGTVVAGSLVNVPFGKGDSQRCAVVIELKDSFEGDESLIKDIGSVISCITCFKEQIRWLLSIRSATGSTAPKVM